MVHRRRTRHALDAPRAIMANKYMSVAKDFIKMCATNKAFAQAAGAGRATAVHVEEGRLKVELEVREEMTNPFGTLHGGCTATLIDVFTTGALLCTERGAPGVSVDLHVSYMAAAKAGEILVLDSVVAKQGKSMAFTKADVYRKSDNVLVATGLHTKAFPQIKS
ncbi:unnamed protein product [Caenorhabditis auriculariae]|uniref:Acyl-coenzyme A thioesterase 13 n=1 Tax=Caenorhabditis auriculariae TaxID=2777116 RepID=A0A8S1HH52_9PELO|nr:unnamed protein product [Caenorhabditis auriculariae]